MQSVSEKKNRALLIRVSARERSSGTDVFSEHLIFVDFTFIFHSFTASNDIRSVVLNAKTHA